MVERGWENGAAGCAAGDGAAAADAAPWLAAAAPPPVNRAAFEELEGITSGRLRL